MVSTDVSRKIKYKKLAVKVLCVSGSHLVSGVV